jgi:hypothetical protein
LCNENEKKKRKTKNKWQKFYYVRKSAWSTLENVKNFIWKSLLRNGNCFYSTLFINFLILVRVNIVVFIKTCVFTVLWAHKSYVCWMLKGKFLAEIYDMMERKHSGRFHIKSGINYYNFWTSWPIKMNFFWSKAMIWGFQFQ